MPTANETRTFFKGKQNRDADPRLIQEGEYISLINGRIARSEGSTVGALENTLGNESVSTFVDATAVVLGSIRDTSNNLLYYFIKGSEEDAIYEYNDETEESRALLRDNVGILNFNVDFLITGINIIGDGDDRLLLWTDGYNPPRKVNIERTFNRLNQNVNGFTEQEISVEKNPPLYQPSVTSVQIEQIQDDNEREELDKEENLKEKFVRFAYRWKYEDGEYSVFSPFSQAGFIPGKFDFDLDTGAFTGMENQIKALDISFNTGPREVVEVDLLYKEDNSNTVYIVETFNKADRRWNNGVVLGEIVENIFLGIGETVFQLPDVLRGTEPILDVTRGAGEDSNIVPEDMYTITRGQLESDDTITLTEPLTENESLVVRYYNNAEAIRFSSNKLYRALPEDQLARVFDNVPIRAKTQEIIQNRIVYGNYVDRYNLEDVLKTYETITTVVDNDDGVVVTDSRVLTGTRTEEIVVDIDARLSEPITADNLITGNTGERSLKSDRNYELGIVYLDNLGRQTPVLTSQNNTVSIPIDRANKINRLSIDINNKAPEWATAYRFFVKQNRGQHFNIIPLESQLQPDDNRFVWFRVSSGDQEKVKEGDYLNIKITNALFAYMSNDNKLEVRVEEIGPQERNFLEVTPPRAGRIVSEGTTQNEEGTVVNDGEIYTAQQGGIWMKAKNMSSLNQDFSTNSAKEGRSIARSNNARSANFQPIRGDIDNYQDVTYYYSGGNVGIVDNIDEASVTFGGTYAPGTGYHEGAEVNGITQSDGTTLTGELETGPNDGGAGSMRIQVEIMEGNTFQYAWWISPIHSEPPVVRRTTLIDAAIPEGTTPSMLVNGKTIVFNLDPSDYNVGDRFVVTDRLKDNFMWRARDVNASRNDNPNSTSRRGFGARRAKAMFTGSGLFDLGINGRSKIQIGVEDGLGRRNNGNPIALSYRRNEFITGDTFYDNFEEMMFEEDLWTSGNEPNIGGTDREAGGFGIHQMGFWRGAPVEPSTSIGFNQLVGPVTGVAVVAGGAIGLTASIGLGALALGPVGIAIALGVIIGSFLINSSLTEKNAWRLVSGPGEVLTGRMSMDDDGNLAPIPAAIEGEATAFPLHGFIESGVYNSSRNNKKDDLRMRTRTSFTQGQGVDGQMLNNLDLVMETVPEETVSDIYFEVGETFPCLNGIHFGNEMSHTQRAMQEIGFNEAGNETQEVTPVSVDLEYFNCYAWENGVESCTIRDEFNANSLQPGAKASTVVDEYEQRENFSNLIFSAPYNQATNTNGLNEFSSSAAALGAIIKEMDEQDGSVQHLFSRDTNLVVFQEDKVSQVLADKNALFGADGTANLTSARPVLGQIIPFAGEFGISKDPESFSVYGSRIYFTDRSRGVVLRLSQQGLEEISNAGMRDFFRDELAHEYNQVDSQGNPRKPLAVGSYDDYHDQYIVSLREPLQDPTYGQVPKPLNISRQAFLSRTDACRFPDADLQYIEVYEFYTINEPDGFQVGDIIYTDDARSSIFLGDNDWFRWDDLEADIDAAPLLFVPQIDDENGDPVDNFVQTFVYTNNHLNSPGTGQAITVGRRSGGSLEDFEGTVVSYNRVGNGATSTISIRFDDTFTGIPVSDSEGNDNVVEFSINYKFVINIDNFGFVRAKADCNGIIPPNHDAVRVSIASYQTPEEACGKGLVARIVYHNGDDATPDVGDSIYDTPYASDEFIDGCYMKGRTQKNGWYQMFDGDDFEDYVIRILQGKVVEKRRCAEVMAGRKRILTSENALQRIEGESDDRLATRVCSMLPTMERFYDGENELPVLGDIIYSDNFTRATAPAGFYAIEDGYYIQVTPLGLVSFIARCSITICVDDVVRAQILNVQNQESNVWNFLGVNGVTAELPTVSATEALFSFEDSVQRLTFNGNVTSLGEFREVEYSWYYLPATTEPSERELLQSGFQIGIGTFERVGPVTNEVEVVDRPFTNYYHMFVAKVEGVNITTPVLVTRTLRDELPVAAVIALTAGSLRTLLASTAMLTSTPNVDNDDRDIFSSQWCKNGVDIPGATMLTLAISFMGEDPFGSYTYKQEFQGLSVESNAIVFVEAFAPTVFSSDTTFALDQTSADLSVVALDADHDLTDLTYEWRQDTVIIAGEITPALTITAAGTYEVTITDPDGLSVTECYIIDGDGALNIGPVAEVIGPLEADIGDEVMITLNSSDVESDVLTHVFTINGVASTIDLGTAPLVNFVFTETLTELPVTYSLTVTDGNGAVATATHEVSLGNAVATSNVLTSSGASSVASGTEVTFTSAVVDDDLTGASYEFFAGGVSQQVGTSNTYTRTESPAIDVTNSIAITSTYTDEGGLMLDSNELTQNWLTATPPPSVFVSIGASSVTYSIAAWNAIPGTGTSLGGFSVPYSYTISGFVPGFSTTINIETSSVNSDGSRSATNIGYLGGGRGGFTANAASGSGTVTCFWRKFESPGPPPIGSITAGMLNTNNASVIDNCTITTVA